MSNQEHDNKGALWAVAIIAFMMVVPQKILWYPLFFLPGHIQA